jgi:nucleoside-diphosphate-sugar epimerase
MLLKKASPGFSFNKLGEGKTAFVTGGGGRIGRSLIRTLQREGYKVKALAENKDFMNRMPSGVVPYVGDINNKKILDEAMRGVDVVFHLAAIVSEYRANTKELMRVNVQGTACVLEACRLNGVGHLVFASTVDVYGSNRKDVLTEESKLKPTDKYGYSKMLAEKEIEKYSDKLDYTIFRMGALYGREFAASYFKVFKAMREGKAYIIGDGNNHLSLVHIDDVVNAFTLAEDKKSGSRNIYNLTDGVQYTQKQLFNLVADMLKVERPSRHISPLVVRLLARRRNLDSDELRFIMSNRVVDISKVKRTLKFKPSVEIKDGAMELVSEFLKSNMK